MLATECPSVEIRGRKCFKLVSRQEKVSRIVSRQQNDSRFQNGAETTKFSCNKKMGTVIILIDVRFSSKSTR